MAEKKTKTTKATAAYDKLRADLKAGTPENAYIFYGEEIYLRERYVEELRQLLVPGLNDTPDNARFMKGLPRKYSCVKSCVFLPFAKGETPALYAALGLEYPMKAYRDATAQDVSDMKYY